MDWANETYVKLFTRDTLSWKRLRWEGQTVLMHLLRKVDRSGVLDGVKDSTLDVSVITGLPEDVVCNGIESLLREEVLQICGDTMLMSKFMEAQETPKSDRQRQRESRENRRLKASQNVTDSHGESQGVTDGHKVSPLDKPSIDKPSKAKPEYSDSFDMFWSAYPEKKNKKTAYKAWKKASDKPEVKTLIKIIEVHKQTRKWKEGYIPNPATWLNGGAWDDEVEQQQPQPARHKELKDKF